MPAEFAMPEALPEVAFAGALARARPALQTAQIRVGDEAGSARERDGEGLGFFDIRLHDPLARAAANGCRERPPLRPPPPVDVRAARWRSHRSVRGCRR